MKIFTIVKNEKDVVECWVHYHAKLAGGYTNIHVIDNESTDGTFELLKEIAQKHRIYLYSKSDYTKKGEYMTALYRKWCAPGEIGLPIDIDEFVVYYDRKSPHRVISCDPIAIHSHLSAIAGVIDPRTNMPVSMFKMNYIQSIIPPDVPDGYENAVQHTQYGYYDDQRGFAKTGFVGGRFQGVIDHRNHCFTSSMYLVSNLCLVHYHARNLPQMLSKIYCNVAGLGYPVDDSEALIPYSTIHTPGYHHVRNQQQVLQGTYRLPTREHSAATDIDLTPLCKFVDDNPLLFPTSSTH